MNKSRLLGALCAAFFSFITLSANAASIVFGAATDLGSCSETGRSDCSKNLSRNIPINTSVFSSPTGIIVRGQASANSGLTGAATADLRVTYDIPYSITRNVSVTPGPGGALASFENFELAFSAIYLSYLTAKDDFGQIGGAQSARAYNASITSAGGFFGPLSLVGHSLSGDNANTISQRSGDFTTFTPGLNASDPRQSEAGTDAQGIPTDFRAWDDFLGPQAQDYSQP
ncbi:MAG: hypothetical protein WBO34_09980, partial [Gammaproteobacteria bacterium]